jgi:hypothetical protein
MMSVSGQMQVADRSATEARLAGIAVVALAVGASVYLLDRDWMSTLFLGAFAGWQPASHAVFAALGATLPSFLHAYAFTVLLVLALYAWRGEFDPADLWATAFGCATGWVITNAFTRRLS